MASTFGEVELDAQHGDRVKVELEAAAVLEPLKRTEELDQREITCNCNSLAIYSGVQISTCLTMVAWRCETHKLVRWLCM